jgi:hypothetical protein
MDRLCSLSCFARQQTARRASPRLERADLLGRVGWSFRAPTCPPLGGLPGVHHIDSLARHLVPAELQQLNTLQPRTAVVGDRQLDDSQVDTGRDPSNAVAQPVQTGGILPSPLRERGDAFEPPSRLWKLQHRVVVIDLLGAVNDRCTLAVSCKNRRPTPRRCTWPMNRWSSRPCAAMMSAASGCRRSARVLADAANPQHYLATLGSVVVLDGSHGSDEFRSMDQD